MTRRSLLLPRPEKWQGASPSPWEPDGRRKFGALDFQSLFHNRGGRVLGLAAAFAQASAGSAMFFSSVAPLRLWRMAALSGRPASAWKHF